MSVAGRPRSTDRTSIEAVIPLHDTARPFRRTVESLLSQRAELAAAGADLTVSIVCHNITAESVSSTLDDELIADGISLTELQDGIYSPAGPKNHALDRSRSDYITFVDSDDYLEPGALISWLTSARLSGADAVLAPIRTTTGKILTLPRIRPSKPQILHPVRDGLATRSLPHGLLRREHLEKIGFRYTEGLRTGEDLEPTLRLFFTGARVAYPYGSTAYCQTDDAGDSRVTAAILPLEEELAWFTALAEQDWIWQASLGERRAIATKLMRVHGIDALRRRAALAPQGRVGNAPGAPSGDVLWNAGESASWRAFHDGVKKLAGGGLGSLSVRDARLAKAALFSADATDLIRAVQTYDSSPRWEMMVTHRRHVTLGGNSIVRHYVNERRRRDSGVFAAPPSPGSPQ